MSMRGYQHEGLSAWSFMSMRVYQHEGSWACGLISMRVHGGLPNEIMRAHKAQRSEEGSGNRRQSWVSMGLLPMSCSSTRRNRMSSSLVRKSGSNGGIGRISGIRVFSMRRDSSLRLMRCIGQMGRMRTPLMSWGLELSTWPMRKHARPIRKLLLSTIGSMWPSCNQAMSQEFHQHHQRQRLLHQQAWAHHQYHCLQSHQQRWVGGAMTSTWSSALTKPSRHGFGMMRHGHGLMSN